MTCNGCKAAVENYIGAIEGVAEVSADLKGKTATVVSAKTISVETLQAALPEKYNIVSNHVSETNAEVTNKISEEKSKLQQLKPLFLIFACILLIDIAINYPEFVIKDLMLDFMGLFLVLFSLFKFFDLRGFANAFRMYDPLAKILPPYGYVYPFIEVALGVLFLARIEIPILLIITLCILLITTLGVTKSLLGKDTIQCACLGTVLQLPMTEATFIENAIMIIMALVMIVGWV